MRSNEDGAKRMLVAVAWVACLVVYVVGANAYAINHCARASERSLFSHKKYDIFLKTEKIYTYKCKR